MSVRMGFLDLLVVLTEVGDIYRINFFGLPPIRSYLSGSKQSCTRKKIMYTSLFDTLVADSFFSPMRTVYVVSDSQLEEIKHKQRQEELDNLEASRKRLEENYQSRIKILDERQHELQEELKALAPAEKKTELPAEETEKCAVKA